MSDAESRWSHLVAASFHLDEALNPDPRAALATLDSVLEVFDEAVDPVDDFRAYAVRRLALSLRRAVGARA